MICSKAIVDIDCPWLTGQVKVTVMKNPVCLLIIGNIEGVSDNAEEIYKIWEEAKLNVVAAVVTRRQSKEETVKIEDDSIKLDNEIVETRQIKSTNEDISDIFSNLVEHYFEF